MNFIGLHSEGLADIVARPVSYIPLLQYCHMKQLIRLFFKLLRLTLGPLLLLWERIAAPTSIERSEKDQQRIDEETKNLSLYQFKTCPFCIKTRRTAKRLSLSIERLDAQHDSDARDALLKGGGKIKVPCLKIEESDGETRWLYNSETIIQYLEQRFAH